MNTIIAVLLPVYKNDSSLYFRQAIDSLLNQTFEKFIVIILIDGPIPNELAVQVNSLMQNERILIKKFDVNRGLPVVLNEGIKICIELGIEFIARMDSDDISASDRLRIQYDFLNKNLNVDLVGTQSYLIDSHGEITGKKKLPTNIYLKSLLRNCNVVHASVMFRSAFFAKYGYYDETLRKSQDYELWLRAVGKGAKIVNLTDYLFYMRFEDGIVNRRKEEQKYNLKIKKKYSTFFQFYLISWKHYLIILMPSWSIKGLLFIRKRLAR